MFLIVETAHVTQINRFQINGFKGVDYFGKINRIDV